MDQPMNFTSRERAKNFIAKGMERLKDTKTSIDASLQKFQTIYEEYATASISFIDARRQYVAYLEKYQDTAEHSPVMSSFPGITSHLPSYEPNEMLEDTAKMKELSSLITDVASQIEILEDQLKSSLSHLVSNTNQLTKYSNQSAAYLDQLVTAMDSAYDVGQLSKH